MRILANPTYRKIMERMSIPFPVGFDVMGKLLIVDLAELIHLLMGGSSNSGKTISLQTLMTTVTLFCSPSKINLVLFDGALNLSYFDKLPHLSCPVIQDSETGFKAFMALKKEMERHILIKNSDEFHKLPSIMLVIDESISFISGIGNSQMLKPLPEAISNILRRGRHAKIHIVLAAQDPTVKDMKCDIGNIISRIAFTCAKLNYSMTILGEPGAERLSGNGELYFKSPKHGGLKYLQGTYITPAEITKVVNYVRERDQTYDDKYKFTINEEDFQYIEEDETDYSSIVYPDTQKHDPNDKLLAHIIVWSLGRDSISRNAISDTFKIGWRRANGFIEKLYELGIVGDTYAKLARSVLIFQLEDLSSETVDFLGQHGYTSEDIQKAFDVRNVGA